jgi:hypothetical protein
MKKNWIKCCHSWVKKEQIISGFFVTLLGVWAAFGLANCGESHSKDSATHQRLQLVHFEAEQNAILAQAVFRNESATNRFDFILKRPQNVALQAALADSNLPDLLPHAKLSMLLTYQDSIEAFRQTLDLHAAHLISVDFDLDCDRDFIRKAICEKAGTVLAASFAIMSDLDAYADPDDWSPMSDESNQQRIDRLRSMALDGRLIISDDPKYKQQMKEIIQQSK